MDEIDETKILIGAVAVCGSFLSILNTKEKVKIEEKKIKQYYILLIRATILYYSLNYKWPLAMCGVITVIISALVLSFD